MLVKWLTISVLFYTAAVVLSQERIPGISSVPGRNRANLVRMPDPGNLDLGRLPVSFPKVQPMRPERPAEDFGPLLEESPVVIQPEEDSDTNDLLQNITSMGAEMSSIVSSLTSIDDFTRIFGLDMPEEEDTGIFARFGGGRSEVSTQAVCSPENKTVELDLPQNPSIVFFPRCVRLQRCGGCCVGPLLSCQPTKLEAVTLKILKVESASTGTTTRHVTSNGPTRGTSRGGNQGRNGGRRRRPNNRSSNRRRRREQPTSYHEVSEVHHTECSCQCRIMENDCNQVLHDYVPDDCQCRCKNQEEKSKCESKSITHYWDNKSCRCYCRKEESCSTGQRFDHASCRCVMVAVPNISSRFGGTRNQEDMNLNVRVPVVFNGRRRG